MKQIIIPKDQAVFRMDGNGRWHNQHGPFEHPKIIAFFHAAIRKDAQGFHLYQEREGVVEKVYFTYEDTALFVFDVCLKRPETLTLNTGRKLPLTPKELFVARDHLYVRVDDEHAKFTDRSMMKMAPVLCFEQGQYLLVMDGRSHVVPVEAPSS